MISKPAQSLRPPSADDEPRVQPAPVPGEGPARVRPTALRAARSGRDGATSSPPPDESADRAHDGSPRRRRAQPVELTAQERRLRFWMRFWAASFALEVVLYLWWALAGPDDSRAFAVNSVAKDLTFLLLAVPVIADVRRFGRLMGAIVLGHLAIVLGLATLVLVGTTAANFPGTPAAVLGIGPLELPSELRLPIWLAVALGATAHMGWLHVTARRARYGLRYLSPTQFDTLVALAQTTLTQPRVAPETIARSVDRYWATFNSRETGRVRLALVVLHLWPLLTLRAPFALLDVESRRAFLNKRFLADAALLPGVIRSAVRFAVQMVHMGYYEHPETRRDTGYVPFSERAEPPPKAHSTLRAMAPESAPGGVLEADIVIVGTGAAGSVLAHSLVEQGHDVLMLERGDFVDPATFTENETEMYSRLYSDGAIQLSRDFAFQVLQGRCVGGTTVVNNAVCFELPPAELARWNEIGAGLPPTLEDSFAAVRKLIRVAPQDLAPRSAGVDGVVDAIAALQLDRAPYSSGAVEANLDGCVGCGYCNLGCAYGKKLSMLDHVLPLTQHGADRRRGEEPAYKGRLRILPACEVTRVQRESLLGSGSERVSGVRCRVGPDRRPLTVKAGTVIVAGGAIHSSRLLQRSMIGGARVGRGLCANIATFMLGDFEQQLHAYEGLQLAAYVMPPRQHGYVVETWFNPVVITALSMPGWMEDHQRNMDRYAHMMSMGVLVGTDPRASNRVKRFPLAGSQFAFAPSDSELTRLAAALKESGRILLEAGATRVMPATFRYREFETVEQLEQLDELLRDPVNRSLQSSHPQGGNPVSADPSHGVVDPTFRVHGYDNLYLCDASVFPTGVTVNPQLTVMALAHHAATHPAGLGALRRV